MEHTILPYSILCVDDLSLCSQLVYSAVMSLTVAAAVAVAAVAVV